MSLAAAMLVTSALASSASGTPTCAGCTLDAAAEAQAMPLLVVLRPERVADDAAPPPTGDARAPSRSARDTSRAARDASQVARDDARAWRAPALREGWAVLTLTGWAEAEPRWIEDQVFAAARDHSIDLSRVYLVGSDAGAAYIARHIQALSETFAAVAITGGGAALAACPEQDLPAYFRVDPSDPAARAMRSSFERCKQPVTASVPHGPVDRATATAMLAWLQRHKRVTTVSLVAPTPTGVLRARRALSWSA